MVENNSDHDDNIDDIKEVRGDKVWSEDNEEKFIFLLEEEVLKGNRPTTTLTKEAWRNVRTKLNENTGKKYTTDQLRNKFNSLRARHREFKNLLAETGIGYSSLTGQVTASDENWKRYYKVHKNAKVFRKRGLRLYEKLCVIFGDTTATGVNAHPSTRTPPDTDDEQEGNQNEANSSFDGGAPNRAQSQSNNRGSSRPAKREKRESFSGALASALSTFSENSRRKVELMELRLLKTSQPQDNSGDAGTCSKDDVAAAKECLRVLNAMDGIDGASYAKAVKVFRDDALLRELFMEMPENRKKDFVTNL